MSRRPPLVDLAPDAPEVDEFDLDLRIGEMLPLGSWVVTTPFDAQTDGFPCVPTDGGGTCKTGNPTCAATCHATCPATCQATCQATCRATCQATCRNTCGHQQTCGQTCNTCEATCAGSCANTHCFTCRSGCKLP